jgi:hypothetical protein
MRTVFAEFMDYNMALTKVVRKWYEQRIREETVQNDKLKTLHAQLTTLMLLKQKQQMQATLETQQIVSEQTLQSDQFLSEENGKEVIDE